MCKSIQARAKQDILRNASGNSVRKIVFSVATTSDQKGAKSDREGAVGTRRRTAKILRIRGAQDRNGDRVVENQRLRIVKLMRGSAESNAEGSSRWTGGLHLCQCSHIASKQDGVPSAQQQGRPSQLYRLRRRVDRWWDEPLICERNLESRPSSNSTYAKGTPSSLCAGRWRQGSRAQAETRSAGNPAEASAE
jgi:hypothetical protein